MDEKRIGEQHGCIVCGKIYNLLVIYEQNGNLVDFALLSGDGKRILGYEKPLVACNSHSEKQIQNALKRWELKSKDMGGEDE
jgi:hypothetical protein